MSSKKQIAANRENAKRSKGPTSDEGRGRIIHNAVKHGLAGTRGYVLPHHHKEFRAELKAWIDRHQPRDRQERKLVRIAAHGAFRMTLCERAEFTVARIEFDELQETLATQRAPETERLVEDFLASHSSIEDGFDAIRASRDCLKALIRKVEENQSRLRDKNALEATAARELQRLALHHRFTPLDHVAPLVEALQRLQPSPSPSPSSKERAAAIALLQQRLSALVAFLRDRLRQVEADAHSPDNMLLDAFLIAYEPEGWKSIQRYRREAERQRDKALKLLGELRQGLHTPSKENAPGASKPSPRPLSAEAGTPRLLEYAQTTPLSRFLDTFADDSSDEVDLLVVEESRDEGLVDGFESSDDLEPALVDERPIPIDAAARADEAITNAALAHPPITFEHPTTASLADRPATFLAACASKQIGFESRLAELEAAHPRKTRPSPAEVKQSLTRARKQRGPQKRGKGR